MEYTITDYTQKYHSIMVFDKNKNVFVHRWYPFVEGYSKEFIESILDEQPQKPQCVLEPFCGSGTTPVEMQNHDIQCYSFDVSPFMHLLAQAKMERTYDEESFMRYVGLVSKKLSRSSNNIRDIEPLPFGDTVVNSGRKKKWNFHDNAIDGILEIRNAIRTSIDDKHYQNLFKIALASIIMKSSNMFRNGKCLSYSKGWETRILSKKDIHDFFLDRLNSVFAEDIRIISKQTPLVQNSEICYLGDVRERIDLVPDGKVDLIITSPPYLNSRDYTDIYMLELKVLQLVNSHEELRKLRGCTIRSHVQVKYSDIEPIENARLRDCLTQMKSSKASTWNTDILNMICGYFDDMQNLFEKFYRKVRTGGTIYFNVANSAYFGVEIPVDYIIADIATGAGFTVREIRKARDLKPSPQQSKKISKLRESVLVIDKM